MIMMMIVMIILMVMVIAHCPIGIVNIGKLTHYTVYTHYALFYVILLLLHTNTNTNVNANANVDGFGFGFDTVVSDELSWLVSV